MVLDPATLALISAVIAGLQVLAFVVLARLNPEMPGVRLWAWSSLASAGSMLVLVSRQIIGEQPLIYAAGFLAVTAALACTAVGAAVFVGRRPRFRIPVLATPVILCIHAWYLLVDPRPTVRIACTAAETTVTTGTNKYSSWRSPDFLLVSCGKEFVASSSTVTPHVPSMEEYWHASLPTGATTFNMTTTGTVSTSYFQDGTTYSRSDNITSWSGR